MTEPESDYIKVLRYQLSEKPRDKILCSAARDHALIGKTHWTASLDKISDELYYKKLIKGYIAKMHEYEPKGIGLLIYGELATGKTSIGTIVLKNALARGGRVLSMRCSQLIDGMLKPERAILPNGLNIRQGLLSENYNYLMIDDFYIDELDWRFKQVETVLRSRYDSKLPTIITTNLTQKDLESRPWLMTLLFERYFRIKVEGINWRLENPLSNKLLES